MSENSATRAPDPGRIGVTELRTPYAARRSPLAARRSPLAARRSPLAARRDDVGA
ncbi:hypothetical protein ACWCRC_20020 [Streptomyces sp. NPDC001940]